jgi:AcrR family transcriptional regulator
MSPEYNLKRELILKIAKKLFWKFGFKRVSIEEVCKEAAVSKMTFYKHFPNKMAVVKTLLEEVLQDARKKYDLIMDSELPYPEKVVQMIELKREQTHTMSSEFFRDYVQSGDPELIAYLEQASAENLQKFTDDFHKAQKNGDIRQDLKVEFIMAIMNKLVDWIQHDDGLMELYDEPQDLAVEMTSFLFYGILNRDVHT